MQQTWSAAFGTRANEARFFPLRAARPSLPVGCPLVARPLPVRCPFVGRLPADAMPPPSARACACGRSGVVGRAQHQQQRRQQRREAVAGAVRAVGGALVRSRR